MAADMLSADLKDMQALIASGFGTMRFSEYLLLDVFSAEKARAWLEKALPYVWSVDDLVQGAAARYDKQQEEAWSLAFTYHGLKSLGIVEDDSAPFPSEFRAGQADETRRKLLREDPSVSWQWGDVRAKSGATRPPPVSILVLRLHDGKPNSPRELLTTKGLADSGLEVVRRVHGSPSSFETGVTHTPAGPKRKTYIREPFGFRDGIAQPEIRGLHGVLKGLDEAGSPAEEKRVPLGEFVLGHRNAYGEGSHCPDVKVQDGLSRDWSFGRNGCYLAVQQILQHVDVFRQFERRHPASGKGPTVAEKMVGRRKDGKPLQEVPKPPASENAFGFRMNDPRGLQCPIGAHIRRANPRDSLPDSGELGSTSSNLHRLLRRGRPFASSGVADDRGTASGLVAWGVAPSEVGLFFIAIVADLARQFEFVKRVWVGSPSFGDLRDEGDPLLGRTTSRRFTIPGQPTGTQLGGLPDFTTTQGGGYFFMPGLGTLARIARGDYSIAPGIQDDARRIAIARQSRGPRAKRALLLAIAAIGLVWLVQRLTGG